MPKYKDFLFINYKPQVSNCIDLNQGRGKQAVNN